MSEEVYYYWGFIMCHIIYSIWSIGKIDMMYSSLFISCMILLGLWKYSIDEKEEQI